MFARNQALIPNCQKSFASGGSVCSHVTIALHNIIMVVPLAVYPSGRNYHSEAGCNLYSVPKNIMMNPVCLFVQVLLQHKCNRDKITAL